MVAVEVAHACRQVPDPFLLAHALVEAEAAVAHLGCQRHLQQAAQVAAVVVAVEQNLHWPL